MSNKNKEEIEACLNDIEDAYYELECELADTIEEVNEIISKSADMDELKFELRKDGLLTDELDRWLDNFLTFHRREYRRD